MDELRDYVYQSIKNEIESWDDEVIKDIYAISLYISNPEDDPRRPMVTLGFNTLTQLHESLAHASDEHEAKWNYAFWLQNEELVVGDNYGENPEDAERITNWVKEMGCYYTDEQEEINFEDILELGERITEAFVEMCVDISKQLHDNGVIKKKFGKEIPVLVHELEYYDIIANQNLRANPEKVISEFVDWIYNM